MYNTGNAGFLAAACNPNRTIDTKVVLNMGADVSLSPDDIISYSIAYASIGGKSFTPGGFVASQLELSLNAASSVVSGVDFKSEPLNSLSPSAGIQVYSNMVYIPMGKFYPEKDGVKAGDDGTVGIMATDIPPVLETEFNSNNLNFPCSVKSVLDTISLETGLPIVLTTTDFPNLSIQLINSFSMVTTYRKVLMYIAEILGGYIQMGRNGEICVKRCFGSSVELGAALDENYLFSVKKQENSVKPFQYISIKADKDDLGVTQTISGVTTECSWDIIDNPLTYGHPQEFLAGLVAPTTFSEFYPATISFQGRPDIDTGDVLNYVYKGAVYILPVCRHVFEYNGGFKTTVEGIGTEVLKSSSDTGVVTQIKALKQSTNNLLRDLSQTQSQLTEIDGQLVEMSTILQTIDALKATVTRIDGDLTKLSNITQTAEQLRIDIQTVANSLRDTNGVVAENQNTLLSYFDFQADSLTIGISSSPIKLKLSNDRIYFLKNEQEVAYFSEGQLYVTDAHFIHSLVLGNFEFTPRNNGNLSLRRRV